MPFNPNEVAEITVNGMVFKDWTSVTVHLAKGEPYNWYKFSSTEGMPLAKDWASIRIRPGDHCTVKLAGKTAVSGFVTKRQVAYTATAHGIEIEGKSYTGALSDGAAMTETMEMKNVSFKQAADKILKPFGIQFKQLTQISDKKFPRINIMPGTTAYEQLETLARSRGVWLGTDEQGNLTGQTKWLGGSSDALIEGKNILEGRETMSMDQGGPNNVDAQDTVNDVRPIAKSAHGHTGKSDPGILKAAGSKGVYRPKYSTLEHPGDKQDAQTRADFESQKQGVEELNVQIVVQGWLKPGGGGLWEPGSKVRIKSPMLIIDEELDLMSATFTQDSKSGTRTTLELKRDTGGGDGDGSKDDVSPDPGKTGTTSSTPGGVPATPGDTPF